MNFVSSIQVEYFHYVVLLLCSRQWSMVHVFIFVNGRSELERMSVERQINSYATGGIKRVWQWSSESLICAWQKL